MKLENLTTHRVDHLPMAAQLIEDIGMIDLIDGLTGGSSIGVFGPYLTEPNGRISRIGLFGMSNLNR